LRAEESSAGGCRLPELSRAGAAAAKGEDRLRHRGEQLGEAGDLLRALVPPGHGQEGIAEARRRRRRRHRLARRLARAAFEIGPVVDDAAKARGRSLGHRCRLELTGDADVGVEALCLEGHVVGPQRESAALTAAETVAMSARPPSRAFAAAIVRPMSAGPDAPISATTAATSMPTASALRRCGR